MGKKLQPKLRFRGFTDAWEPRKLKSLLQESTQTSTDKEILSVTVANGIYPAREGARESNPGESLEKYKVVHENDIVYNSMRLWQGAIAISHYEGIVSPAYTVCIPSVHINPDFISYLLKRPAALRMFYSLSQGNSKDTLILKYPLFSTIKFSLPAGREQYHIARLLRCVDQLIDAEKRKLNLLKDKKTALLRQIFDQKARFKGYTDPWEPRRLGEICSFKKGQGYSKKDTCDSGTPLLLYGQMYTNYATAVTSADAYTTPHPHSVYSTGKEVIVPSSGETQEDIAVASAVLEPGIIYGGDINILTPPDYLNPVFLALTISGGPAHRRLAERAQGKTIVHLRNLDIAQVDIALPEESEQVRIAELFMGLDNLIDAESRKIDLLELKKKALLQQMFV